MKETRNIRRLCERVVSSGNVEGPCPRLKAERRRNRDLITSSYLVTHHGTVKDY